MRYTCVAFGIGRGRQHDRRDRESSKKKKEGEEVKLGESRQAPRYEGEVRMKGRKRQTDRQTDRYEREKEINRKEMKIREERERGEREKEIDRKMKRERERGKKGRGFFHELQFGDLFLLFETMNIPDNQSINKYTLFIYIKNAHKGKTIQYPLPTPRNAPVDIVFWRILMNRTVLTRVSICLPQLNS